MTAFSSPICLDCENFRGTRADAWGLYCASHPEPPGIPKPVAFSATRTCANYRPIGAGTEVEPGQ